MLGFFGFLGVSPREVSEEGGQLVFFVCVGGILSVWFLVLFDWGDLRYNVKGGY
jgi:hypothetical protein